MFARSSAFAEVIALLDEKKLQAGITAMTKQIKNPDHNYSIGGSKDARLTRPKPTTTS